MATKASIRPAILTFPRCISPSNATMLMRANGENERPLLIQEMSARGVQSSEGVEDKKKTEANPQFYECAFLDRDANQLVVSFDVDFSRVGEPSAVSDMIYREWIESFIEKYRTEHGFRELGRLYAWNLANGRFLWRNQRNAHKIDVRVTLIEENGEAGPVFNFVTDDFDLVTPPHDGREVSEVAAYIAEGLSGARKFASIRVEAVVTGSYGREVFPSQSMVMDKGKLSKYLFCIEEVKGERRAGMHSQKIGNAIRTIDQWYEGEETLSPPIPVEVYGTVSSRAFAYRSSLKNDFYSLIDREKQAGEAKKKDVKNLSLTDLHYVMAVIVRGGVFNGIVKKDEK